MKNILKKYYLLLSVALVVIAGGIVWLVLANRESVNVNKQVQSKCEAQVKDKTFCKFAGAFANAGDYRAEMTFSTESGTTSSTLAIASNGNSQMTVSQSGMPESTVVSYDGDTYVKDPTDNQWMMYAKSSSNKPEISDVRSQMETADFKNAQGQTEQYVNKGAEVVNGFNCYKYQVLDPSKPGSQDYMWFDKKSYLLRKISTTDSSGSLVMNFTYGSVNIGKPSPVKTTIE